MACRAIVTTEGEQGLLPKVVMHDLCFESKCTITLAAQTASSSQQPVAGQDN